MAESRSDRLSDVCFRLNLSQVISVGLTLVIAVEGIGRKKCLIVGGLGQSVMMLWIGVYRALHPAPNTGGPYSSIVLQYISIVAVYFYAVFYSIGWGPIPWVVAAEVAPNHLRTAVISTATGVNWYDFFIITIFTHDSHTQALLFDDIEAHADYAERPRLRDVSRVRLLLSCHGLLGVALPPRDRGIRAGGNRSAL